MVSGNSCTRMQRRGTAASTGRFFTFYLSLDGIGMLEKFCSDMGCLKKDGSPNYYKGIQVAIDVAANMLSATAGGRVQNRAEAQRRKARSKSSNHDESLSNLEIQDEFRAIVFNNVVPHNDLNKFELLGIFYIALAILVSVLVPIGYLQQAWPRTHVVYQDSSSMRPELGKNVAVRR